MHKHIFAALMFVWGMETIGPARGSDTAAVFPVSSVESVDVRNQLLTFKTTDGRLWLLRVADPAAMKRESLTKGDLVSLEVDLDDQIVKILKVAHPSQAEPRGMRLK